VQPPFGPFFKFGWGWDMVNGGRGIFGRAKEYSIEKEFLSGNPEKNIVVP
jgi:hypothetical protein